MANISFKGSVTRDIILGGIAGTFGSRQHEFLAKNCVNYGRLEDTGSYLCNHIGGITGMDEGTPRNNFIVNCANLGTIIINGKNLKGSSGYMRAGGISGISTNAYTINCLSAGEIKPYSKSIRSIGSIHGYLNANATISHCYHTLNTGYDTNGGFWTNTNVSVSDSYLVELNESILKKIE